MVPNDVYVLIKCQMPVEVFIKDGKQIFDVENCLIETTSGKKDESYIFKCV